MQTGNEHSICREPLHASFNLRKKQPCWERAVRQDVLSTGVLLGGQGPGAAHVPGRMPSLLPKHGKRWILQGTLGGPRSGSALITPCYPQPFPETSGPLIAAL